MRSSFKAFVCLLNISWINFIKFEENRRIFRPLLVFRFDSSGILRIFLWEDLEWNFHNGIEAGRCATIFSASKNQFHCFFAGLLTRKAAVARAGSSAGNWNVARINFIRPSSSSFAQFADRPAGRPLLGTTASCRSVNFTLDDRTMTVPFEIYHKFYLFRNDIERVQIFHQFLRQREFFRTKSPNVGIHRPSSY